ncbi:MAG: hypothetical protein JW900_09845 [Anaerolineae bacterium]|nr:hypothetical protein [Anaerolineae bacterium]
MNPSVANKWLLLATSIALVGLAGLACGTGQESSTGPTAVPLASDAATTAPTATGLPAAVPTAAQPSPIIPAEQQPLEVAGIPELEVVTLDARDAGLGHLGSFRQRMVASFTDVNGNGAGTYYYDADVNTVEEAVHMRISIEGPEGLVLPDGLQVIWIGTRMWFKLAYQPWVLVPDSTEELPFSEQMFSVGDFLPYASQFQRVMPDETINEILCAHYTYDEQDIPTDYGTISGRGEVYVALDGGYVVRYTFDGSGTFSAYYQGQGTLSLVYDTYDVGAPIDIEAPR